MQTIYKYPIEVTDNQHINIPRDGKILTVQVQGGQPCLWVLVDPDNDPEDRHIEVFGTGHPISDDERDYIGTFQMHGGALIFHVFELST